jgi:molybdenum cofactor cytidylyltransferase
MINNYNEFISDQCAIILLAAGSSTRMGKPKQLLRYNGDTFLSHILNISIEVNAGKIIVVLGSDAELLKKELNDKKVFIVINNNWVEGMASSIRCGLNALDKIEPSCDKVIFLACDQPFVSASLLNKLISVHNKTGKQIVVSSYANTIGIPALFHKSLFAELKELKGDTGAKKIILKHKELVEKIPFSLGSVDIDTIDDYAAMNTTIFKTIF